MREQKKQPCGCFADYSNVSPQCSGGGSGFFFSSLRYDHFNRMGVRMEETRMIRMTNGNTAGSTNPQFTPFSVQIRTTSARTIMPRPTRKESCPENLQNFAPSPHPPSFPISATATNTNPNARNCRLMRLKYSIFAIPIFAKKMGEKKRYPIWSTLDSTYGVSESVPPSRIPAR